MTDDMRAAFELRYHSAMPNWCKIVGLQIKVIPECEGGGFVVEKNQAEAIVAALQAARTPPASGDVVDLKPFSTYPEDRATLTGLAYTVLHSRNTETRETAADKLADLVKAILDDEDVAVANAAPPRARQAGGEEDAS